VVNVDANTKKIVYYTGNAIFFILKYFCLLLFIFSLGMTIGLTIFSIAKGDNMPNTLIANMVSHITGDDVREVLEAIVRFGKTDTIVAACGLGFADAITYILLFFVVGGYKKLYKSLILGNIYTNENFEILKESVPLSSILLFTQPIIITFIRDFTHINDSFSTYNFIGIPFVIISTILYLVVEKGILLENKIKIYEKKLSQVEEEKQEAEILALEKEIREKHALKAKKAAARKTTKKVEKKEVKEEVKEEAKKKTKTVKKSTTKKATTAKKTVAKTTKKKASK